MKDFERPKPRLTTMAAVAGFASWQSRVVAQRGAFRAGCRQWALLADRGRSFAAWGRCAATRAFLPAGLSSGRRSGRRTMAAGWGNGAGVCRAAVWVAAPSRLAPCVRSTVVVTELGYGSPDFAGARGLAGHSLWRRGQSALMRPEPLFGTTKPRKLCVQGRHGFSRGLGGHRMRQRCRLRR